MTRKLWIGNAYAAVAQLAATIGFNCGLMTGIVALLGAGLIVVFVSILVRAREATSIGLLTGICCTSVFAAASLIWLSVGPWHVPWIGLPFERGLFGRLLSPFAIAALAIVCAIAMDRVRNGKLRKALSFANGALWIVANALSLYGLFLLRAPPFGW